MKNTMSDAISFKYYRFVEASHMNGNKYFIRLKQLCAQTWKWFLFPKNRYHINKVNTKIFYNFFIEKKRREPACIRKWTEDYPGFQDASDDLWPNIFRLPFNVMRDKYFQTLQYKIIHRLIACQKKLAATLPSILYGNSKLSTENNMKLFHIVYKFIQASKRF